MSFSFSFGFLKGVPIMGGGVDQIAWLSPPPHPYRIHAFYLKFFPKGVLLTGGVGIGLLFNLLSVSRKY